VTLWFALVACRLPASNGPDVPAGNGALEVDTTDIGFDPLDIGTDPPASQHVSIWNGGSGPLSVRRPQIEGDEAFRAEGSAIVLQPSDSYGFDVVFDPQTPFSHEAALVLESDAAGSPLTKVPLHGDAIAPVIEVGASTLEMGKVYLGCRVIQSLAVQNTGNETLEVVPSLVGSPDITLADGGDSVVLAPGKAELIQVAYDALDEKAAAATLTLDSNDPIHPRTEIDVTGAGGFLPVVSDRFEGIVPAVDVVFAVDDSHSMLEEQAEFSDHIDSFVDSLVATGIDYRIGVITSDASSFAGDVVTNATTDPATVLADQIAKLGTGGAGTTRSLQMLYECVEPGGDCSPVAGFLRDHALLDAIIVADDPDESDLTPEAYVDYLLTLKSDPDLVRVDAIAGHIPTITCSTCSSPGFGYDQAVDLTGGAFVDICGDWDDNLAYLGTSVIFRASWRLELSETPQVDTIEVFVDGVLAAPGTWTYVVNAIQFDLDALPPPTSKIEVRYTVATACG
jgi:hypothetical protein